MRPGTPEHGGEGGQRPPCPWIGEAESAYHMLSIYRFCPLLSGYICSSLKLLNKSNVYEKQNIN